MFPPPNNQPPGSRDEDCLTLERDQLDCIKGAGSNFQLCIEGYLVHTVAEAIEEGDVTSSVLTE